MIRIPRLAALALGLSAVAAPAFARDYRPVVCAAARPYAGPALHAAVAVPKVPQAGAGGFDPVVQAALDAALAQAVSATGAPAITAAVVAPGRGRWTRTTGAADQPLLFWASAGKTLTATVVLQLADEGKLTLDDPVSRWVKGVPNGHVVTVRDLLAHTGGLFSANEDLKARGERRAHSLAEDVRIIARHGAMACPGERWRYSNTGYALLGEIIRQVDGRGYEDAITERIIKPLGLAHMRVMRPGDGGADLAPLVSAKEAPIVPAWAGAAGPVAASADDMASFWAALLDGRLLRPQTVQAMFERLYPMFDEGTWYGLGVTAFEVPEPGGGRTLWMGHAGGTPGAGAIVLYSPADKAFVAVALTGDGSAAATANLLLKQLR